MKPYLRMNRLRALLSLLQDRFLSRWQHPEPRHTGKPPEPPSEPEPKPEGIPPGQLTQMDFPPPVSRVPPYVDGPKHRKPR